MEIRAALLIAAVLCNIYAPLMAADQKDKKTSVLIESTKIENITARLSFIEPCTTRDCSIEIELVAAGEDKVLVWESSDGPLDCKIGILDTNGKPCLLTAKGTAERKRDISYDTIVAVLERDRSKKWIFKLNDLFIFEPGVWTLDVKFMVNKGNTGQPSSRSLVIPFKNHAFTLLE